MGVSYTNIYVLYTLLLLSKDNRAAVCVHRFCFIKLNLLLVAVEMAGDDGVDTTIAINPDSNVKIDLNFQGFFIAESADDVKRFVSSV